MTDKTDETTFREFAENKNIKIGRAVPHEEGGFTWLADTKKHEDTVWVAVDTETRVFIGEYDHDPTNDEIRASIAEVREAARERWRAARPMKDEKRRLRKARRAAQRRGR